MGMADELLALASCEGIPEPAELQHAKELMHELCRAEPAQRAERNLRLMHNAYLNIQMAKVCEDSRLMAGSMKDFRRVISDL
ncbi:hypothetical protein [Georhizobium profundi]|nr:hypothetical protein [Georhizobium profundi]